jgi:hypothetical protein
VKRVDGAKRLLAPRALRHPWRMLEHAAEPLNELAFLQRIRVLEPHVR